MNNLEIIFIIMILILIFFMSDISNYLKNSKYLYIELFQNPDSSNNDTNEETVEEETGDDVEDEDIEDEDIEDEDIEDEDIEDKDIEDEDIEDKDIEDIEDIEDKDIEDIEDEEEKVSDEDTDMIFTNKNTDTHTNITSIENGIPDPSYSKTNNGFELISQNFDGNINLYSPRINKRI
jgi:hypothetical protein